MAFESVRSYIQLASGLGELTRARAMEAAQGLLVLPGADEVTRRAVQASTLADQLLEAAKANRANLMSLVQAEVESALSRAEVARVADIDAARTALTGLAKEVADLRSALTSTLTHTGAAAVAGAVRAPLARGTRGTTRRSGAAVTTAVRAVGGDSAPDASPTSSVTASSGTTKSPTKSAATRRASTSASKKATATKKAAAKKSTGKRATAKQTTAKRATAKRTTAQKATGTNATGARQSAASKSAAKRTSTVRGAAAKKSAAKKSTAKRTSSDGGATT